MAIRAVTNVWRMHSRTVFPGPSTSGLTWLAGGHAAIAAKVIRILGTGCPSCGRGSVSWTVLPTPYSPTDSCQLPSRIARLYEEKRVQLSVVRAREKGETGQCKDSRARQDIGVPLFGVKNGI